MMLKVLLKQIFTNQDTGCSAPAGLIISPKIDHIYIHIGQPVFLRLGPLYTVSSLLPNRELLQDFHRK